MSLLKFRPKVLPVPTASPPACRVKYGLYPVGDEVLMSAPTFEIILHVLANRPQDGNELAVQLRRMYDSTFISVGGSE